MVSKVAPTPEETKNLLKFIRKSCDPDQTERKKGTRYGHILLTIRYYKSWNLIATIYKTDGEIVQIDIYIETPPEF